MRVRTATILVAVVFVGLVPARVIAEGDVVCPTVAAPELAFEEPQYIDEERAGGEPVSIVAQDGSIIVSAHAGTTHVYKNPEALPGAGDFAVGYTNQTLNWRSSDGGDTWEYVGLAGLPAGPHSPTSTGFSDPDLTMDASGRIYNVEIDLANVAVFSSPDDGQSWPFANPESASGDRPWVTGGEANEVYLYINLPKMLFRSTDGGLTFLPVKLTELPIDGKLMVDPRNPETGLIAPVGGRSPNGIGISNDKGVNWTTYTNPRLGPSTQFFGSLGVDSAGHAYQAAAGARRVTFNYFDRDAATPGWGDPVTVSELPAGGEALWPWVYAGDDGRVAIVWYQTHPDNPRAYYIYAAFTTNGHGTWVTCDDESTRFVPPQFTVVNASGRPIHVGDICLSGTTCNANPNFEAGDRRLGDFFTVNHDAEGRMFIVSGDTMLPNPLGGPKPVANPIFIRQSSGDRMLEKPMETRPTRCLWPLPTC